MTHQQREGSWLALLESLVEQANAKECLSGAFSPDPEITQQLDREFGPFLLAMPTELIQ
jgi:hypothetical protein